MGHPKAAQIAVAGPIALLAAMLTLGVAAALSDVASWPVLAVPALLPVALCLWLAPEPGVAVRAALCVTTLAVSIGVGAAVFLLVRVPLLEGIQAVAPVLGVYTPLWGPTVVVLIGSIAARARSGAPLLGPWLVWWIPVAVGIVWVEPLAFALVGLARVDDLTAGIALFAAPTLGMSAWVGAVSVLFVYSRFARGHLTRASTRLRKSSATM